MSTQMDYAIDVVFCIDATGGMVPFIDSFRAAVPSLYGSILDRFDEWGKPCDEVRIKIIAFRDYKYDKEPMTESHFFNQNEVDELEGFLEHLTAEGGGDEPENALEALALAIKSDWNTESLRRRHVIVMITDAAPLELGERKECPGYPEAEMPENFEELLAWMGNSASGFESGNYKRPDDIRFISRNSRLLLVTPDDQPWTVFTSDCLGAYMLPVERGNGCADADMENINEMLLELLR
ncbi:MAG: VWA domain-containing protein [Clostridia bacterium]|nr:VWA domain-containing protein [Clostridia bacterium]